MKYRAVCPGCGGRLSRRGCWEEFKCCPACGARIRADPTWDRPGNWAFAGLFIAAFFSGPVIAGGTQLPGILLAIILCGGVMGLAWWLWPYFTPYELVTRGSPPTSDEKPATSEERPHTVITNLSRGVRIMKPRRRWAPLLAAIFLTSVVVAVIWSAIVAMIAH